MRQRRTIYFNDARHYYLFVYDPPMRMEDAWSPIDEVAGTSVDTFSYGVSRADGLFYPSKVGLQWGSDRMPFQNAYEWRCWENMQSLTARGLDPLQVLIDRAHEKNMDFIASLRLGEYGGMDPDHSVGNGGRGFVHSEVRDHQRSVVEELATAYNTEAVELDFSAAPGGCAHCLNPDEAPAQASVLTDFVRDCATAVRGRSGDAGLLGARVYPSPDLNQRAGLDVDTWLNEGLVDFIIPSSYACFFLDSQMPIDWIVEAAHRQDTSVYGILQPYYLDGSRINTNIEHMSTEKMRAAAANFWQADVDGLCTWFMDWPLEQVQRQILTELGDPDLTREGTKHYFLRQRAENPARFVYDAELPVAIKADADKTHEISFTICDDPANERIGRMRLKINVADLVPADVFDVRLNGVCLASEPCRRYPRWHDAYIGTWLEFELNTVRPVRGTNTLQFALRERPASLEGEISIDDVELIVEYDLYAAQNETAREGAVT
ncbi:MAG: hypothetical protein VX528_13980 [Candidatus Latescibacterota bacterium]|nr:hypothetical protein [Candidatus Latescibacterota bacterium]